MLLRWEKGSSIYFWMPTLKSIQRYWMSFFFFHFRLLAPVDRRGQHLRALSGSWISGMQPLLLDFQPAPLCPSLPQVPATASFCLDAKSIITLGIFLLHPSPPPPPSIKKSNSKSAGRRSEIFERHKPHGPRSGLASPHTSKCQLPFLPPPSHPVSPWCPGCHLDLALTSVSFLSSRATIFY